MAEIVSLSQCAIGIGPCCLKMSARALRREKEGTKHIFTQQLEWHSVFSLPRSLCESGSSWISTINKKKKATITNQKIYSLKAQFLFVCLLPVFIGSPGYCLVYHMMALIHFTPGLCFLSIVFLAVSGSADELFPVALSAAFRQSHREHARAPSLGHCDLVFTQFYTKTTLPKPNFFKIESKQESGPHTP